MPSKQFYTPQMYLHELKIIFEKSKTEKNISAKKVSFYKDML